MIFKLPCNLLKQRVGCLTVSAIFVFAIVAAEVNVAPKANMTLRTHSTKKVKQILKGTDGNRLEVSDILNGSTEISVRFEEKYIIHYFIIYGDHIGGWLKYFLSFE